jgi:hypothetical protein
MKLNRLLNQFIDPQVIVEQARTDPELYDELDAFIRSEMPGYTLAGVHLAHDAFDRLLQDKELCREIEAAVATADSDLFDRLRSALQQRAWFRFAWDGMRNHSATTETEPRRYLRRSSSKRD